MKTHWLYGTGPNKEVKFEIEIDEETNCILCIHDKVCDHKMNKRCSNYVFGDSWAIEHCNSCLHRFTRYDKDVIPCFHCKDFMRK